MAEHTPTPWRLEMLGGIDSVHGVIASCTIKPAHFGPDVRDANAAFIVRACNEHEELKRLLRMAMSALLMADRSKAWREERDKICAEIDAFGKGEQS